GQTWDYLVTDGSTLLHKDDLVRAADGRIYKYKGVNGTTVNLSDTGLNFSGADWEEKVTDNVTLKSGYTVRVDPLHTAGGLVGRIYRFLAAEPSYSTLVGTKQVKHDDVVLVELNHDKPAWMGREFKYKGGDATIDLSIENFEDPDRWEELSHEENGVAVWREDFSDTKRWQLATDYADPATVKKLAEVLTQKAQMVLAPSDTMRPDAKYNSADGLYWDYTTDKGDTKLKTGDRVGDANSELPAVYRYLGEAATLDLGTVNFTDTTLWVAADSSKILRKGDTVQVADDHRGGGDAGRVYSYIGKNKVSLDLSHVNYLDTSNWQAVVPVLEVSTIEAGKRWKLLDADGHSYTLTMDASGSLGASRNSINAVSVAASAAIGLSASSAAVAISGAGAVAINSVMGHTDALIGNSVVTSAAAVKLDAHSQSSISATIASLSVAVAAGMGPGVGASIGISIARNLIGQEGFGVVGDNAIATVQALVINSSLRAAGDLLLTAAAKQTIDALVLSGSVALGLGADSGIGIAGSGVWAENQIGNRVHAGVDTGWGYTTGQRLSDLSVRSVDIEASDNSRIRSLQTPAGPARNVIATQVLAEIAGARLTAVGDLKVIAKSAASIEVTAMAAALAAAIGGTAGVGVSGAGASAMNIILGDTLASVDDSAISAAGAMDVKSSATSRIEATIVSASIGVGGGNVGVGASIGIALARNYIGYDPSHYSGAARYTSGVDAPAKIVKGDVIRLGPRSGARANEVYEYIGDADLLRADKDKSGNQKDLILTQDYADTKLWKQLTATSANQIEASVTQSSIVALDDANKTLNLSVIADNLQTIDSAVFAGSVAIGGGLVGVAISGAGASAVNRIGSQTLAYVGRTTTVDSNHDGVPEINGIEVDGFIHVLATDNAKIDSSVMAVSVAAAFGEFGASVAIGVSLADNLIASSTQALVDNAALDTVGDIS
ncbi:MAG: hypothetical protein EBY28_23685, partial [Betaproteobacteria bacterium]|nr:hypothetical protein [Betaproteobacteria bacterium]